MKFLFGPLFFFILFITNPRPSKQMKINMTVLFVLLAWLNVYLLYSKLNEGYFEIAAAALLLVSTICIGATFKKKKPPQHELISFVCPFCLEDVEFDIIDKEKSRNCPECKEVVTVTEDEKVHKAAKESYDEIMAAMESEDLQEDPENLTDPSIAPSVLGFQFELNKGNNSNMQSSEKVDKN